MAKGLTEEEADMVVARLATNKEKFLEDMLANEVHIHKDNLQNPYVLGGVIGLSFLVGALVPLLPFYIIPSKPYSVITSVVASLIFLFAAGGVERADRKEKALEERARDDVDRGGRGWHPLPHRKRVRLRLDRHRPFRSSSRRSRRPSSPGPNSTNSSTMWMSFRSPGPNTTEGMPCIA